MSIRDVEVDDLATFDAEVARTTRLRAWFVSSLDLSDRTDELLRTDPRGAVFLGCRFATEPADVGALLRERGALLFPALPDVPFDPYRAHLYTPEELYGVDPSGHRPPYDQSLDARIWAWTGTHHRRSLTADLGATLHDHSVDGALDDVTAHLDAARVVGVMGGHALRRGDEAYAAAARLGEGLGRAGRTVLTGGGPGAMEAANLGAYLAPWHDEQPDALATALASLAAAPGYGGGSDSAGGVDGWAEAAFAVRRRWTPDRAGLSLSVPTWFYGHEPTNVFGTAIAKYFANALREDTLLHRCGGGIVFAPGASGTVQEVFQSANDRYYATRDLATAPLVLLGVEHWTRTLPAWPLLAALAGDSPMAGAVHVVDDVEAALEIVAA